MTVKETDIVEDALLQEGLKKYRKLLRRINDEIWEHPEIRFVEHRAHDLLTKVLEEHQFKVTRNYILETGFRAEFSPESGKYASLGPNVCFICEYDALPIVGHACGHNLIAESGIAMALLTQHVMTECPSRYPGKITVIGSPGEEGGGGKIIMIEAFNDVDVAMMLHPSNKGILHTESICSSRIFAAYSGKRPEETAHYFPSLDRMLPGSESDAAVAAYNAIQVLRAEMPHQWRIGAVIKKIDHSLGLEITYRTLHGADMSVLCARIVKCLEAGGAAAGCQLDWRFTDPYLNMWPNICLGSTVYSYLKRPEILFEYGLNKEFNALLSTDMGNVSHLVPSIHPMYYIDTPTSLHHPDFAKQANTPEAENRMLDCAQAAAHTALKLLRDPNELLRVPVRHNGQLRRKKRPQKYTLRRIRARGIAQESTHRYNK
ncbi:peptidase M20 domain-containing protein 2-like isoform X1 [Varroa destructor]|uniref:Peptidase M20 domain-containing protein 2 n=1 Tax=Varroa destructor TaxID=109461 RepID=A0A7M7JFH8_VARDE|nr:peptidase M20 domain-containing protein 2-like isoform X1 [Varroa destructor]XP_022645620.1 peptidase M20 domain-containing protein 2-like isoform X1 [Varroa destructor]